MSTGPCEPHTEYTHTQTCTGVCVCVYVCLQTQRHSRTKAGQSGAVFSPSLSSPYLFLLLFLSVHHFMPTSDSFSPSPLFFSSFPPHVNTTLLLSGSGMPEGQSTDRRPVTMTTASPSCLTPRRYWLRAVGGGGRRREREREIGRREGWRR